MADASWNLYTDAEVELFTGAPHRGHKPVFAEWTYINKSIECNTAIELWNAMLEIIQESTKSLYQLNITANHFGTTN